MLIKKLIAASVACVFVLAPVHSFAGGAWTGGATEWTQILNNYQLQVSVVKQTAAYATQLEQYANQVQAQMTRIQNLTNLPADVIAKAVAPYKTMLASSGQVLQSVNRVRSAYTGTANMLQSRYTEMVKLGQSPQEYLKYEAALASQRRGDYAEKIAQDQKAMQEAIDANKELQAQAKTISSDNTNAGMVAGIQKLATITAMAAGTNASLLEATREANISKNQERDEMEVAKQQNAEFFTEHSVTSVGVSKAFRDAATGAKIKTGQKEAEEAGRKAVMESTKSR